MSLFFTELEIHEDLLRTKGYDENGLNSPDKPGWFMKQLERQFSLALREGNLMKESQDFSLKTAGFFDQDKDVVLFTFHYLYNPEELQLSIRSIEARMDDRKLSVTLRSNKDLPLSKAMHKSLQNKDQALEVAKALAEHTVTCNNKRFLKRP